MKILLTGSFGNIGLSTLKALIKNDHQITCFDLLSRRNKKIEKNLQKKNIFHTIWGDIRNIEIIAQAVKDQDCIIHLAAILPPLTEKNPEFAQAINVAGTRVIVEEALNQSKLPKIIYSSSFSIYGPQKPGSPPLTSSQPIKPTDVYTNNKADAEKIIRESGLPWTILRIAAIPSLSIRGNDLSLLYGIPLEQQLEFAHTYDVGQAFANVIDNTTDGKVLLIGGGKKCQFVNRNFVSRFLETLGVGMLPDSVFKKVTNPEDWYYTNWMDTEESQKLLQYQEHTFEDYLDELGKKTRILRLLSIILRPFVRRYLIKRSPYHK